MTPTILHATDEPVFEDMDEKPILSIFSTERAPEVRPALLTAASARREYSEEEQRDVEERLRQLGYID